MTSVSVASAEMAQQAAPLEAAAPEAVEAAEPLLLTRRAGPGADQIAFAGLSAAGLALTAIGVGLFFSAAPMDVDPTPALIFVVPGLAAAFAGLFFLARRARQTFA